MKFTCIMEQPSHVSWFSLHMYHSTAFTCITVQPSRVSRYSLYKDGIIFPQSPSLQTQFFQLCMRYRRPNAYSSSLKHLSSSGMLNFSSLSSARQHPKGASFSGPKRRRMEMTNSDCREDKEEQSTPPLQLPPLCGLALSYSREN